MTLLSKFEGDTNTVNYRLHLYRLLYRIFLFQQIIAFSRHFKINMENTAFNHQSMEESIRPPPSDLNNPPKAIPLKSLNENYQVISDLGIGSFGVVALAKYKKNKHELLRMEEKKRGTLIDPLTDSETHLSCLVAIKTMKERLNTLNEATRVKEVKFILRIPSHPSLVQIYDMFIDNQDFHLHIVMETMNQNLHQLMRARRKIKFSPATLKSVLTQLLDGIRHIHKHDYFHRDVKPENILIMPTLQYYGCRDNIPPHRRGDNYVLKLADYGLARHVGNLKAYTSYVSTRWYRSPEILLRRRWYSKPVDMWAFGIIAVEVANFVPLFPGASEVDQIWRILEVLGSPTLPNFGSHFQKGTYYIPLGGYWKEAQQLASRLGFTLPYSDGVHICHLIPESVPAELGDIVKACLTWNPDMRADVGTVCSMPYFKGTTVSNPYKEPERPSNMLVKPAPLREVTSKFQLHSGIESSKTSSSYKRIIGDEGMHLHDLTVPQFNNENYVGKSLVPIRNNTSMLADQFQIHDDFDDGYEKEFMKEYTYEQHPTNHDQNQFMIDPEYMKDLGEEHHNSVHHEINNTPPELAEDYDNEKFTFYDLNYSNNEGDAIVTEYDSDNTYAKNDADYSWEGFSNLNVGESIKHNTEAQYYPKNLKALKEPLEEEFGLIADLSFGSHEIKC